VGPLYPAGVTVTSGRVISLSAYGIALVDLCAN
jgi:hypothetical protein